MALQFVGIDPDTGDDESATVWIDDETRAIVFQGESADEELTARISAKAWKPGHAPGVPAHESVISIPAHMVPIIRKACDAAERAGLYRPVEADPEDSGPSGDA